MKTCVLLIILLGAINCSAQEIIVAQNSDESRAQIAAAEAKKRAVEEKETEVRHAISDHRLIIGMTMDQAREAWGKPAFSSVSTNDHGGYGYWVYRNRARDIHGAPCDRQVFFDEGIITGWTDS